MITEEALLNNSYKFIEVLLNIENSIDWTEFLTIQRLYVLYNSDRV